MPEVRQRGASCVPDVSMVEKLMDRGEAVANKASAIFQSISMLFAAATVFACVAEGIHLFSLHAGIVHPELIELEPPIEDYISTFTEPFENTDAALILFNSSLRHHRSFIQAARTANAKHKVLLVTVDCDRFEAGCLNVHIADAIAEHLPPDRGIDWNGDEPEILYIEKGYAVDSYHISQRDGSVKRLPEGASRAERVQAMLEWMDVAHARAPDRKGIIDKKRDDGTKRQKGFTPDVDDYWGDLKREL